MKLKIFFLIGSLLPLLSLHASCFEAIKADFSRALKTTEEGAYNNLSFPSAPWKTTLYSHIDELGEKKKFNHLQESEKMLKDYKIELIKKKENQLTSLKYILLKKFNKTSELLEAGFMTFATFTFFVGIAQAIENIGEMLSSSHITRPGIPTLCILIGSWAGYYLLTSLTTSYINKSNKIIAINNTLTMIDDLLIEIAKKKALITY